VGLQALYPELHPLYVPLEVVVLPQYRRCVQVPLVQLSSLLGDYAFQLLSPLFLHLNLLLGNVCLPLPVGHLLPEGELVGLQLRHVSLHVLRVHLEVICHVAMAVHIMNDGFPLILGLFESLICEVELVREVVDVPLQGVDLLDAGLLAGVPVTQVKLVAVQLFF